MSRLMRSRGPAAAVNPQSAVSEAYRGLRTNISFSFGCAGARTVMITSALPGEGKSTTAVNVAVSYAQSYKRVLLIDADLRTPVQHQLLGLTERGGLSTALIRRSPLAEAVQETSVDNLYAVSAGPVPPNPAELLDSAAMTSLLQAAKERFDMVIVDTPPATTADSLIVASKCDAVVLVVSPGKVKRAALVKAKEALEYGNATIIGAVFNRR